MHVLDVLSLSCVSNRLRRATMAIAWLAFPLRLADRTRRCFNGLAPVLQFDSLAHAFNFSSPIFLDAPRSDSLRRAAVNETGTGHGCTAHTAKLAVEANVQTYVGHSLPMFKKLGNLLLGCMPWNPVPQMSSTRHVMRHLRSLREKRVPHKCPANVLKPCRSLDFRWARTAGAQHPCMRVRCYSRLSSVWQVLARSSFCTKSV